MKTLKRKLNFYYLEGCDGSGKTTFGNKILNELRDSMPFSGGTERVYPEVIKFPSKYPDKPFKSPIEAVSFYISDFTKVLLEVTQNENYNTFVFDRSFISTIIYQGYTLAMINNTEIPEYIYKFSKLGKIIVDVGVYLFSHFREGLSINHNIIFMNVDEKTCYERLYKRIENGGELADSTDRSIKEVLEWRSKDKEYEAKLVETQLINDLKFIRIRYVQTLKYMQDFYPDFNIMIFEPSSIDCDFLGFSKGTEALDFEEARRYFV